MSNSAQGLAHPLVDAAAKVLVVDDDAVTRCFLEEALSAAGYSVALAATAEEASAQLRSEPPDLVLLDLHLPDRSGQEVLEEIREDPSTRLLPVLMLTGTASVADRRRAQTLGVSDFILKPFSSDELLARVHGLVLLKQFADEHEHAERVILTLAKTIDARDPFTAGHSGRVAEYADKIAIRMGLDVATRQDMRRGALFHDLGKIVIPDAVLRKPGVLTPEEREIIEQHPVVGHELLSTMRTMRRSLPIVYHHHERLDGSGYPDGISGSSISIPIRIVTVADIFDALTTDRSYRGAMSAALAFDVLYDGVGRGWLDADAVGELSAIVDAAAAAPPLDEP
jgi:putative two-component system response regulator